MRNSSRLILCQWDVMHSKIIEKKDLEIRLEDAHQDNDNLGIEQLLES